MAPRASNDTNCPSASTVTCAICRGLLRYIHIIDPLGWHHQQYSRFQIRRYHTTRTFIRYARAKHKALAYGKWYPNTIDTFKLQPLGKSHCSARSWFIMAALSGTLVVYFALFSGPGVEVAVATSVYFDVDVRIFVLGVLLLSLLAFGALGWAMARWISRAYRNKTVNDQSLLLDALWLLFASGYTMWLILGGLVWATTAIVAFVGFKLSLKLMQKITSPSVQSGRGLTFLRVFSLGRRSEQLLENVAKYWRHIGSVQMITGPDVARSTVQPHQLLDFLSGDLASHFVHDRASLIRSITEWDCEPDSDGRYRINSLFCHADTWQQALPQLAQVGDMVLMDLRSFSATNAGCIHEIQHLVADVSLNNCLLIVDKTTDMPFLEGILQQAWQCLPPYSPNKTRSPSETPIHQFDSSPHALRQLVRQLCDAEA